MRFSALARKEIINLQDGKRLGRLGESDFLLDEKNGKIMEIIPKFRSSFFGARRHVSLPWAAVRRIGPEVIIVDLTPESPKMLGN